MTQQPFTPTVSHDIALHCQDDNGRPMAFISSFGYHPEDPYAVGLTFHIPSGEVRWLVARCLLQVGLTEPAGEGDIRLRPGLDDQGRAVVMMDFRSPEGQLIAHARAADVHRFLDETRTQVPAGLESQHVDLDELVESLLT